MNVNLLCVIALVSALMTLSTSLRLIEWPPLNCTQEGLRCSANISACSDRGWVKPNYKTPTGPSWNPEPEVMGRRDERGELVPVIVLKWRAPAEGSIDALRGAMVRIMKQSSDQSLCVRYVFLDKIKQMLNPRRERWSFSLERVVVDPGQTYLVSISHLPIPEKGHNKIEKKSPSQVRGVTERSNTQTRQGRCSDPRLQGTKVCRESGSLWKANLAWNMSTEPAVLAVSFNSAEFSEKYLVSIRCPDHKHSQTVWKGNQTLLNVTFAMDQWPEACCDIVIQPFFTRCNNSCIQTERFKNCSYPVNKGIKPEMLKAQTGANIDVRKDYQQDTSGKVPATPVPACQPESLQVRNPRKVLLIYSLDHPLYKDIVLKLCAFLRAKCGIEVVLDLLDTAWLGAVGRMQWLDWQKQQIERSSDKILILCSRGVRAKWRAMCGEGRVMLKEDARSPMGDMLTPALNLIIPDFVHCSSFQKYMVAYFEDVSSEDDVPAPFNVTIKYKLMKHFEELYFRILDKEKHEPGKVNRIDGIAQDEYFNCPSGGALRDAVETLQAYQLENPDWFERECVDSEEQVAESELQHPLLADVGSSPVFECVPECREGPPILVNEVEVNEDSRGVQELIPLVQRGGERLSIHEFHPGFHPSVSQLYYSHPVVRGDPAMACVHPSVCDGRPCSKNDVALQEPPALKRNVLNLPDEGGSARDGSFVEDHRGMPTSAGALSPSILRQLQSLQQSLGPSEDVSSVPVGVGDHEKRPPSGSDQGYISRSSIHRDPTLGGDPLDPLVALSRLQEVCLLNSLEPLS
ncbi:hypothetical protein AAFF_G00173840 [Aldrovandia affinis]|uniref:SEFIR domain-containing protein n=1 Tax=Aldrovandia affinis TaxID=143900 RepID=A0AAD7SZQ8_9TELE|nr:hypothetical protein AAFF_G00173840 [Aldrovandia affinis]